PGPPWQFLEVNNPPTAPPVKPFFKYNGTAKTPRTPRTQAFISWRPWRLGGSSGDSRGQEIRRNIRRDQFRRRFREDRQGLARVVRFAGRCRGQGVETQGHRNL